MTDILDKVADLAIAPITNLPLTSTATVFTIDDLAGDISLFPDPLTQGYFCYIWQRTDFANVGDAGRAGQAERVRVTSRDVGAQQLTVVRGTSPIDLNVAGKEYWIVLSMNADLIEQIDDRIFDLTGIALSTTKSIIGTDLLLDVSLNLRTPAVGVAPVNLFESPANGSSFISLEAPDALAGSFPIVLPDALPGGTEFLTIDATGVMGTSLGTAAISLDASYDAGGAGLGRIMTADAGPVEIQGADGLRLNTSIPKIEFETDLAFFNWRIAANAFNDVLAFQRGDQDSDISDDVFETLFVMDGTTRRIGINTTNPQELIHANQSAGGGAAKLRLQTADPLQDASVTFFDQTVARLEIGLDNSANAFIIGRLSFANPEFGISTADGKVSIGKAPGTGATGISGRLDIFNDDSATVGLLIDQRIDFGALVVASLAISQPLVILQPSASNARGDISFSTNRTNTATAPGVGEMWYDAVNDRLEFEHASSLTQAISTPWGPSYGDTQQVAIVGVNITVASGGHYQVAGAAFPAADILEGIIIAGTGPKDGDTIMLRQATGSGQITVSTTAGNIRLNGNANIGLNVVNDTLVLVFLAATSQWVQVSHSNNAI